MKLDSAKPQVSRGGDTAGHVQNHAFNAFLLLKDSLWFAHNTPGEQV